jgi:flagellin
MRVTNSATGIDVSAMQSLWQASTAAMTSAMRLSTLRRINSGADDPSGLIAASMLQAQLSSLQAASSNTQQSMALLSTADSGLSQVDSLLNTIRSKVVESAGNTLTDEQLAANQTAIDGAVSAINMIGQTTTYGSRKVLNGEKLNFSFSTDGQTTVSLDLPAVSSGTLGGSDGVLADLTSGGSASLSSGDLSTTLSILDDASAQISEAREQVGSIQTYAVNTSASLLSSMETAVTSTISQIMDTDFATETSLWARAEILTQATMSSLSIIRQRQSLLTNLLDQSDD